MSSPQPDDRTYRLRPQPDDATVWLDPYATVRLRAQASHLEGTADSATLLDPEVWRTTLPAPAVPVPEELHRSGPGVPSSAAAAWHGTTTSAQHRKRGGRASRLLLPLLVLAAVLGYLAWPRVGAPLTITTVTVSARPDRLPCNATAAITGTIGTNSKPGTVTYHWIRSDGTESGPLTQHIPAGQSHTAVVLRWSLQGHGRLQAKATLQILAPDPRTATATFHYICP